MKWLISVKTDWLMRRELLDLTKQVFAALTRHGAGGLSEARDFVMGRRSLELHDRVAVTDVCQVLQDASVRYQIHKMERVDIDYFVGDATQPSAVPA